MQIDAVQLRLSTKLDLGCIFSEAEQMDASGMLQNHTVALLVGPLSLTSMAAIQKCWQHWTAVRPQCSELTLRVS